MDKANTDRQAWLGLLARAPEGRTAGLLAGAGVSEDMTFLRQPEIGSVMVRGRAGGTGTPFNLGEVTVTRCSVQLGCGTIGHGHIQGRRKADARAAALVDAFMQTDRADLLRQAVLEPLRAEEESRRRHRASRAEATKVEFFTMVRGENK